MKHLTCNRKRWMAVVAMTIVSAPTVMAQPAPDAQRQPPAAKTSDGYGLHVTPATQPAAGNGNGWTVGTVTTPQGTFTVMPAGNVNLAPGYNLSTSTTFTPNVTMLNPIYGYNLAPVQGDNLALNVFMAEQKVPGAYLGVGVEAPSPALRSQLKLPEGVGLVVNYVDEKSTSHDVIHQHDVLEKLDDQLLVNAEQLVTLVRLRAPGAAAQLTLIRESKPMQVTVKLGEKEQPPVGEYIDWQPALQRVTDARNMSAWMNTSDPALVYNNGAVGMRHVDVWQVSTTQPTTQPGTTGLTDGFAYVQAPTSVVVVRDALTPTTQPWVGTVNSNYVSRLIDDAALVAARASRSGPITIDDGETLTWLQRGPEGMELTVVDRANGKVTFRGPIGTDEQWQKVPEDIRKKFKAWEAALEQAPKPPTEKK